MLFSCFFAGREAGRFTSGDQGEWAGEWLLLVAVPRSETTLLQGSCLVWFQVSWLCIGKWLEVLKVGIGEKGCVSWEGGVSGGRAGTSSKARFPWLSGIPTLSQCIFLRNLPKFQEMSWAPGPQEVIEVKCPIAVQGWSLPPLSVTESKLHS